MDRLWYHVGVPLGVLHKCGPPSGMQTVPTDDPVVQEAAEHTMKMLQQGSNSLASYELKEVVSAQAEVCCTYFVVQLVVSCCKLEQMFWWMLHSFPQSVSCCLVMEFLPGTISHPLDFIVSAQEEEVRTWGSSNQLI